MHEPNTPSVVTARSGTVLEVLSMSAPLVISHMSQSLMWVVDTLIMGRVGTVEQGAVGLGGVLLWALVCFFAGTMTAVNILVAQGHGAGRTDLARHVRAALVFVAPMSLVLAALWPLVPHALGWVGATQAVRPHAQCYIQIRLYAAPLMLCSFVLTSYLRGLGTMWIPMAVSMSANVVNAALAVVLVFGHLGLPRLGVAGAAWASTVAASVECAIYLGVFLLAARSRALGSRSVRAPSAPELRRFAALGLPIGLAWLFEMVAWTSFSVYAGTRSPVELAAHMVLFQVTGFCFMPAVAIGVAASTLVGHYLGARRPDLAWRSAGRALGLGVSYMTVVGSALVALRHPLLVAFNPDAAVVALGTSLAVVAGLYQPFDGFGIVTQGILRGAGRTAVPTYVMLGSGLLVFIPLVWVLGERAGLGVRGAWLAALAHVVVVSAVLGTVVARGRWRAARPAGVLETPLPVAR